MSVKKPPEEKIGSIAPFGLRMLPDLRERIERAAAENGRSLNAEIVHRLELSLAEASAKAPRLTNDEAVRTVSDAVTKLEAAHKLMLEQLQEFKRINDGGASGAGQIFRPARPQRKAAKPG